MVEEKDWSPLGTTNDPGSAPPWSRDPSHHQQTTISIHGTTSAITTIPNSLSTITVHSSALTKLWDSAHQLGFSNRHKITKTGIEVAIATICDSLSLTVCNNCSNDHSSTTKPLDVRQRPKSC